MKTKVMKSKVPALNAKERELEQRLIRIEAAIVEAMHWLSQQAPGRAYLALQDALRS